MTSTQTRYAPPTGLLMASLGATWVVFSPLSGETMVLNNESAAILEVLRDQPGDLAAVCDALTADVSLEPAELARTIGSSWTQLIEAGLIAETALST